MISKFYCTVLGTILLLVIPLTGTCFQDKSASVAGYDVQHFDTENGLPQNSVKSIVQDPQGNIWLATESGLARFDGRRFAVFRDFDGSFLNASMESFHINPAEADGSFLASNHEMNFIRIANNHAINDNGTYNRIFAGLTFIDHKNDNWYVARGVPYLNKDYIFPTKYIIPTGSHRYYVYNKKYLQYFDHGKRLKHTLLPDKSFWNFFRIDNALYLAENGVFTRFESTNPTFGTRVRLTGEALQHPLFGSGTAPTIFWNNCTNQTFILLGKSLYALSPTGDGQLTSHKILEGFDFQENNIQTIYYDQKARRIFLGSQLNGLFVLRKKAFTTQINDAKGADNIYYGQTVYDKSSILTGQGSIFTPGDTNSKLSVTRLRGIADKVWWDKSSILVDRRGDIWCKQGIDLYWFDRTGQILKKHWNANIEFTQLYEGRNGTIWVATRAAGLCKVDPTKADPPLVRLFIGDFKNISWVQEQSEDVIWVATGNGLFKVLLKSRKVFYIKGLENIFVKSLYIPEGQDEVWLTTYKDGLFLLKKGRLTRFPLDKQKHLASAHCVVEDSKGFFWVTTNNGLFQIKKADLLSYAKRPYPIYYYYHSKTEGFLTNEFNGRCQPCAVRLPNGLVSLPSLNGLVWFKPDEVVADLPDNSIVIDRIVVDGRNDLPPNRDIIFEQKNTQLKLFVGTAYFGNPYNMDLSYALTKKNVLPTSSDWIDVSSSEGAISISRLSQGNYTIHFRKQNGFGQGNYEYKTIDMTVPPEWYQNWWFYLACLLAAALLIFLFVRERIRAVNERNVHLENQIAARTRELRGTLEQFEQSQSELLRQMHLQSRLMASIAHDVRTPLGAAIIVAAEMKKMIADQKYDQAWFFGDNIENAMRNVKETLEGLLAYVKVQVYKKEVEKEKVYLASLVEKNFKLYGKGVKLKANTFINEIASDVTVFTRHQLLDIIVHNLIDNANKFTTGGFIRAYATKNNDQLQLIIEDSGQGFPADLLEWFVETDSAPIPDRYTGIGLVLIKEITPQVGEKILVERLETGTRFTLIFPRA